MDWNVVVTIRGDFAHAVALLRKLGTTERIGLYNVVVMRVPDVPALLDRIAQLPASENFFATISHVVPVTHKLWFTSAEELEQKARDIVLAWAPQLAGKSFHVRMHRRGHKGEIHGRDVERYLGSELLDALERRGTPGRFVLDDPDAIIAIEMIRDEAGLALWTRADLDRYPFLRASIEPGAPRPAPVEPAHAPSRALLAATRKIGAHSRTDRPASEAELLDLLGELEPLTLQKLLATGASIDEVAEAVNAIEDDDTFDELHRGPSSPREAEVRAILEDLVFEDAEERDAEREVVRT